MEDAAEVMLVRVPIEDTVLVRVVALDVAVPLLTRDRTDSVMLSCRDTVVAVDLTVPVGFENCGIGDRERADDDLVDVMVPPTDFVSAADPDGLRNLFVVDDIDDGRGCDPEAVRIFAASLFAFSNFAGAGAGAVCFGTGMLEGGAFAGTALGLVPAPIFQTLRTSDFAEDRKPNRDFDFAMLVT